MNYLDGFLLKSALIQQKNKINKLNIKILEPDAIKYWINSSDNKLKLKFEILGLELLEKH